MLSQVRVMQRVLEVIGRIFRAVTRCLVKVNPSLSTCPHLRGISTCDGDSLVFTDVSPCVPASCPTLDVPHSLQGSYDGVFGDEIQIQCHVGYVAYQHDVRCVEYLHWNHNPRCDPQPCDSVVIENSVQGSIFGLTDDRVEVECLPSHQGGGVAICQGDNLTFSTVPACTAMSCTFC